MGRQIIKQPNGLYAVFSSIVDDFIIVDATSQDIIAEYTKEAEEEITKNVISTVRDLNEGKKPYYQFTMTFKQACRNIKNIHGNQAESLRYFSQKNQRNKRDDNTDG